MNPDRLGPSPFNYEDYTVWRFIHYYQQIRHVMALRPQKVLEVGPGDHTVCDFMSRKGIEVRTLDADPNLQPDYVGDLRTDLPIAEKFDLVLASEVFEHMNLKWLDPVLKRIKQRLVSGGHLVVSVPYSTVRIFPTRGDYGRVFFCEGRVLTHIPLWVVRPLADLAMGLWRILACRCFRSAFRFFKLPEYPDDRVDVHHWDLGWTATIRGTVRNIFLKHFELIEERTCVNTNCVFFILRKLPE